VHQLPYVHPWVEHQPGFPAVRKLLRRPANTGRRSPDRAATVLSGFRDFEVAEFFK
jgi:hypothetical protein